MAKKILLLSLMFSLQVALNAQNTFIKFISGNSQAHGYDMISTQDGGYAFSGKYDSASSIQPCAYFVKTDASGQVQWARKFATGYNTRAFASCQLSDQSYVITGEQTSSSGNDDGIMLLKFDVNGNFVFNKVIDGQFSESAKSIFATSDGGVIICGSTYSFGNSGQIMVCKCDALGNIQWSNVYGTSSNEFGSDIIQTSDGGFIICGETDINGFPYDGLVLKLNSTGVAQWSKVVGVNSGISMQDIIQTSDGNYAIAASVDNASNKNACIIKLDATGNLMWATASTATNNSAGKRLKELGNGHILLGGSCSPASADQTYFAKLSASGNFIWEKYFNIPGSFVDRCIGIKQPNSNYYAFGTYTYINNKYGFSLALTDTAGVNCSSVLLSSSSYTFSPTMANSGTQNSISPGSFNGGTVSSGASSQIFCTGCGLTIQLNPNDTTICTNNPVSFNALVSGPGSPYTYQWSHGGGNNSSANFNPASTTIFTLTVTNSNNCIQTQTQKIYIGPADSVSVNPTICAGYPVTLNIYGGWNIQWNTGSNASTITVAPPVTTIYTANVQGNFGCNHTYSITVNVNNCPSPGYFCKNISAGAAGWGFDIIPTLDGNYAVSGYGLNLDVDAIVSKISNDGNIIWHNIFGNPNSGANGETVYKLLETSKGHYLGVGSILNSSNTKYDGIFVCYDRLGNLLWRKSIDYFYGSFLKDVLETPDGGFVALSNNNSNAPPTLVKIDSNGNLKYIRILNHSACGGNGYRLERIHHTNGGYLIAGQTECTGAGGLEFFVMKMDTAGVLQWYKTVGTIGNEYLYDMMETSDGGIIMCGMKEESGIAGGNAYMVKLDALGNLSWTKVLGMVANSFQDYFFSVIETNNQLVFGGALYNPTSTNYDPWILATDLGGNILWNRITPGSNYQNLIRKLIKNSDGSIAATGTYQNNTDNMHKWLLHKYDLQGNSCCTQNASINVNYTAGTLSTSTGINPNTIGGITALTYYPVNYLLVANTDCFNPIGIPQYEMQNNPNRFTLFPNPVNSNSEIFITGPVIRKIFIHSIIGQEIPYRIEKSGTDYTIKLETNSGLVFITLYSDYGIETLKLLIE